MKGILTLSDRLQNICFMQGLYSHRIQTTVRSQNHDNFDTVGETALEEESAIISKIERYRGQYSSAQCTICKTVGHLSSKCFSKTKWENRVSQFSAKKNNQTREVTHFACEQKGHFARECKNPRRKRSGQENQKSEIIGNRDRLLARSWESVSAILQAV
jgi:hypothetical protein